MKYDDDKTFLIDIGQVNRRLAPNYNRFIIIESKTTLFLVKMPHISAFTGPKEIYY